MPSAFAAFPPSAAGPGALAAAAAVDQRTGTDSRFLWDPSGRIHPTFHGHPGLSSSGSGSASLQELTLLAAARRSAAAAAAAAAATGGSATGGSVGSHPMHGSMGMTSSGGPAELHPAYRLNPYVEHLYSSLHSSPTASLRGLSPLDPRGLALHADYMANMSVLGSRMGELHHSPSLLGSTELPFSLDGFDLGSRLASPRPAIRQSRKRALSSSPYSDSLDLGSMIRFSPNSLVSIMNGSRSSSTSGSYGHLSAGQFCIHFYFLLVSIFTLL